MNEETYNTALKNVLTEIKNICPDIKWSFILTKNGTISADDDQSDKPATEKAAHILQTLVEKSSAVGGLDNLLIDGKDGNVYVSYIGDMHLVTATSKNADISYLRNITGVLIPTVLKVLDSIVAGPSPLKPRPSPFNPPSPPIEKVVTPELVSSESSEQPKEEVKTLESASSESSEQPVSVPSQQFIVEKLGGLLVKSDTVEVDKEILQRWEALLSNKDVSRVEIQSFAGKTLECKVKKIGDSKLEGRGLIRMPEKSCSILEVRRGELVRVQPIIS